MSSRNYIFIITFALIVTACTNLAENNIPSIETASPTPLDENSIEVQINPSSTPHFEKENEGNCSDPFSGENPGFSTFGWKTNFCKHSVPYSEIISGGPPRDGIPPIDSPKFVSVSEADEWLRENEPVIFFSLGSDSRAYPLQILIWHEIVNDFVDGIPVVVTFCPLCNTALVFERPTIEGTTLTFGTSGNLRNSDLIMWDRQTETWWQQFSGEAIVGDLTGTKLTFLPTMILSWQEFKEQYPSGKVLSRDTGFTRDYGRNPYAGYDNVSNFPFLYTGEVDDSLPPMARVTGVLLQNGLGKAYTLDQLRKDKVINDVIGDEPVVIFWKSGTSSAVDTSDIAQGQDVGTTGVYSPILDNTLLNFVPYKDGLFKDTQTESTWNILGMAIDGIYKGKQLTPLIHHDTFWFAWAAFMPNNE